jgi:hypothetical protein
MATTNKYVINAPNKEAAIKTPITYPGIIIDSP